VPTKASTEGASVHVNAVMTGRWTVASDDACLKLHFWRQRDERLTDRGRNRVSSRNETTIMDTMGISILPEIRCWRHFAIGVSRAITKPNTTTKPKAVGYGSRSVRDIDSWKIRWLGELLIESLEGRRRFQCRASQSLLVALFRQVSPLVRTFPSR
jgi:hypothetical protein